ncbi:MAG: DNA repair protein RecN [Spirochaetaceae bacterium]|jgi:DNA repair protein RecN (Recombination protein N)|nr:DNA repair protein RecN [Spirochaetaceae bacterium]
MLEYLSIKDFALIESVSLDFTEGFTVLTGETGAGKSILIGALSFLLGGKAEADVIRTGAPETSVGGTFHIDPAEDSEAAAWLAGAGIDAENNRILLRRILRANGKTGAWIGDRPVTRSELAAFSAFLVDIHGQHDHQSLLRVPEHRRFLDAYAGITAQVGKFTALYARLVEKRRDLAALDENSARRTERMEMLAFAVSEIGGARFKSGEDEELAAEENRLAKFEKLFADVDAAAQLLDAGGGNLVGDIKRLSGIISSAAGADPSLETLYKRCEAAFYELSDIAVDLRAYGSRLVFDPARFEAVQERLAFIFKLKKKYAAPSSSLGEVIAYGESAKKELEKLSAGTETRDALAGEIAALERDAYNLARAISGKRRDAAVKMAGQAEAILEDLGMKGTGFTVSVVENEGTRFEQKCGPYGMDSVEFLFSPNAGSLERPLAKIASGGEISRVMLALKTILTASDDSGIGTVVFDEIDSGIGGEVAIAVGSHLKKLAKKKQVFCITHLATIAVYADTHIVIEKRADLGRTVTSASPVSGSRRVSEVARMLAGWNSGVNDAANAQAIEHARSLLQKYAEEF